MNTVKRVIEYTKHLKIPLVWEFNNCKVTLAPYSHDKLLVTSDSTNEGCENNIFHEDDGVDALTLVITRCTATVQHKDGTWESDVTQVLDEMHYVLSAPTDIDKVAGWLIEQYEAGNTEPLVERVQKILSNMDDASMSFYEEDKQVCAFYQNEVSRELFDNAFDAMSAARASIVKLSSMQPRPPKYN